MSAAPLAEPGVARLRTDAAGWAGRAFGLELSGDFEAPGLDLGPDDAEHSGRRAVRLALDPERVAAARARPAERVHEVRGPTGALVFGVDRHGDRGYLIDVRGFGAHLVADDGSAIWIDPPTGVPA